MKNTTLIAIADCLKGIDKEDLTTAERKIMAILITEGIAEYSDEPFKSVRLKK